MARDYLAVYEAVLSTGAQPPRSTRPVRVA
jgi:hypothetical protein